MAITFLWTPRSGRLVRRLSSIEWVQRLKGNGVASIVQAARPTPPEIWIIINIAIPRSSLLFRSVPAKYLSGHRYISLAIDISRARSFVLEALGRDALSWRRPAVQYKGANPSGLLISWAWNQFRVNNVVDAFRLVANGECRLTQIVTQIGFRLMIARWFVGSATIYRVVCIMVCPIQRFARFNARIQNREEASGSAVRCGTQILKDPIPA